MDDDDASRQPGEVPAGAEGQGATSVTGEEETQLLPDLPREEEMAIKVRMFVEFVEEIMQDPDDERRISLLNQIVDQYAPLLSDQTSGANHRRFRRVARMKLGPDATPKERQIQATVRELLGLQERLRGLIEPGPQRKSNKKIETPWEDDTLYPVPNVQNRGTRNLADIISGAAEWIDDPARDESILAVLDGKSIGRIDLTPGRRGEAERKLTALVSPRTIKTMVATSRLIFERTNRLPFNKAATLSVGEVARAMGYEPGNDRGIKPEILHRIGHDLRVLSRVLTWAADGPYDRKTQSRTSDWIAPLIIISAVHIEQQTATGATVPYEFDAMLGRNWAQAFAETDLLQVAPGFMQLEEGNAIRLGWYYLTEFRYRMTDKKAGITRTIRSLCQEARIDPGEPKHRGRFLQRFEKWHDELQRQGVIGSHRRTPMLETDCPPSEVYAKGEYIVRPPKPILEAYAATRAKAQERQAKQRRARQKVHDRPGESA
jgi:hypothetical protein